jgi:PPM family protein phosphatase
MRRDVNLKGKIEFVAITDPGRVREHNEDALGHDLDRGLLVLADGMGGYNAGEVASGIAVKTTVDMVQHGVTHEMRGARDEATGLMRQSIVLRDAILRANKIIHQTAKSQPNCEGMGTTIVACLFYDNRVTVAHVGDSRVYRVRKGALEQLTQDHSLLQELVGRGLYSREEAERTLSRNYVTRALGVEPATEVTITEHDVEPGDLFVLCSDGLNDMVEDEDILLTIRTFQGDLELAGRQLVRLCNDNGGKDNVSILMARILKPFSANRGLLGKVANLFG